MKRIASFFLSLVLLITSLPAVAEGRERDLRILFTHDIHSYFIDANGGAARLKTLLDENRTECSLYLDAGDFSMGTLLQAAYATDACELRILGELGCAATTFGNHEFDYGDAAVADMLNAARESGDPLPSVVQANMLYSGDLTEEQQVLADALTAYGVRPYTILDAGGLRVAVFGLFGLDSLDCTPTTHMEFRNYIEAAKETVRTVRETEDPDLIVCLSHAGTTGDGVTGEDFDLAKEVPDIDVIISGHSHSTYETPVCVGKTLLVSCGEYLSNLGVLDVSVGADGVACTGYSLIPCEKSVPEDAALAAKLDGYKQHIGETYLAREGIGYDDVLCRCPFDFMSLAEMTATHQEYPFGDLIADAYLYEAKRNGIDDIDVALVGLGTVRDTFRAGDVTTADAFRVCSLGVGGDGSAGHPLLAAYVTGKELKLLTELDASFGPMLSYVKMSYSGLSYTFNEKRMLLDRVTDAALVRADGTREEIRDDALYKVACNMYAANMLGMLNGLTHGILKITPKYADGTPIEDFYDVALQDGNGREIKEWTAFKNYLLSFPQEDGVPTVPLAYREADGRKNKTAEGGLAVLAHPGAVTVTVIAVPTLLLVLAVWLILRNRRKKRR